MVLLDKLWDDVFAGQTPDHGLGRLRNKLKPVTIKEGGEGSSGDQSSSSKHLQRSISIPTTPPTPVTPITPSTPKENVWRSVFHPGSNIATKSMGGQLFDKPQPNSPTVYDWLYSGETRSKHR